MLNKGFVFVVTVLPIHRNKIVCRVGGRPFLEHYIDGVFYSQIKKTIYKEKAYLGHGCDWDKYDPSIPNNSRLIFCLAIRGWGEKRGTHLVTKMSELGNYRYLRQEDEKAFCLLTLSFLSTSSAAGYRDNASWLLLDKKYGRYYVIRVTMDTYTTGTTTINQTSDNWYRFPAAKNRLLGFKVSLLREAFSCIRKLYREPLIDAHLMPTVRLFGVFNDENGGAFEANLKELLIPTFQFIKSGQSGSNDAYQCTDLMDFGVNEKSCKNHPSIKKSLSTKIVPASLKPAVET